MTNLTQARAAMLRVQATIHPGVNSELEIISNFLESQVAREIELLGLLTRLTTLNLSQVAEDCLPGLLLDMPRWYPR